MAILTCKKCSAPLDVVEGQSIVECAYCNTKETVSFTTDEKRINLYNQANALRIKCDFDRAANIYESIIAEFPDEAEAYWCLCLCNYGIEYVDDPATARKIPTCHRASFESIRDDENYKKAIKYADENVQKVYREEAEKIDAIIERILSVCKNEKPYDIFICYKEKDKNNERTVDSILAEELYDALTNKGYKVFFSMVSLRDKGGIEYEPYIFAALNSAKVMLAVGTSYEHYDSAWVKNEWSRFLKLSARDNRSKVLLPCFKDMSAKDLPKEFKALHAQDLGRVGIVNDIVRGMESIIPLSKEKEAPAVAANPGVESLLKRAFIFLEDGDFDSADEYCEKVLDINPECAEAYIGKLMAELCVTRKSSLAKQNESFEDNKNFQKAYRYANAEQKAEYEGYVYAIITANNEKAYRYAVSKMENAKTDADFLVVAELFEEILEYKDAYILAEECYETADEIVYQRGLAEMEKAQTPKDFINAAKIFDEIINHKDSEVLSAKCKEKADVANKQLDYEKAVESFENPISLSQLQKAEDIFAGIKDYKDSADYLAKIPQRIEEFKKEEIYTYATYDCKNSNSITGLRTSLQRLEEIGDYKDSANLKEKIKARIADLEKAAAKRQKVIKQQENKKRTKKVVKIAVIIAIIVAIIGGIQR